jgi:hypothetical protein
MTGDMAVFLICGFSLGIFLIARGVWGHIQPPPPPPMKSCDLTVALKVGEMQVAISYHSETESSPFVPNAERLICRWASAIEAKEESVLYDPLESLLTRQLAEYAPIVRRITLPKIEALPAELPEKLTLADYQVQRLRAKKQAVVALVSEDNSDLPDIDIKGRSLKLRVEDDITSTVNDLFNHPDHA